MPAKNPPMMICKLVNLGNTVGVTVPAAYRRKLNWRRGDHVTVQLVENDGGQPLELRIWSIEHVSQQPTPRIGQTALTKTGR